MNDPVNHPKHYTEHPSGVECITITEHMSFCLGNAMKYLWRADLKNGVEDLKKAAWYINREIAKRESVKLGGTPALVEAASTQVPWIPDALCHACGVPGGYAFCGNPNCKNKPLNPINCDYDKIESADLKEQG